MKTAAHLICVRTVSVLVARTNGLYALLIAFSWTRERVRNLGNLGKAPLLLCGDIVWNIAGKELVQALKGASFKVNRAIFGGKASREEIDRLSALGRSRSSDFVIALGGGKTIDTAKTVADGLVLQVAILPTTASTDAPCSALSVLYRPSGEFHCCTFFDKNPNIVLVDTNVISKAPARFLAAGMGDAIATNVEACSVHFSTSPARLQLSGPALRYTRGIETHVHADVSIPVMRGCIRQRLG
ncbi:Dehydroquinate synthase-like protein [Trametes versicolor FP-101664 SS1]|uniref:Dehydroquinate synthase-like protein n=1 Tax=Trametes versicolor (strain FP-101664) TaxID=717944 RepID=UPI0004623E3A|nr:Dehydroquinate synthase-like protein [Trametes versicolor FP-101664 SS1]EIW53701.1 Dehydroquinate synthase-like protein [Trametes versicolor FP-101664 SS1]